MPFYRCMTLPSKQSEKLSLHKEFPGGFARFITGEGPQQGLFNITLQVKEDCVEEVPLESHFGARLR